MTHGGPQLAVLPFGNTVLPKIVMWMKVRSVSPQTPANLGSEVESSYSTSTTNSPGSAAPVRKTGKLVSAVLHADVFHVAIAWSNAPSRSVGHPSGTKLIV